MKYKYDIIRDYLMTVYIDEKGKHRLLFNMTISEPSFIIFRESIDIPDSTKSIRTTANDYIYYKDRYYRNANDYIYYKGKYYSNFKRNWNGILPRRQVFTTIHSDKGTSIGINIKSDATDELRKRIPDIDEVLEYVTVEILLRDGGR